MCMQETLHVHACLTSVLESKIPARASGRNANRIHKKLLTVQYIRTSPARAVRCHSLGYLPINGGLDGIMFHPLMAASCQPIYRGSQPDRQL